MKKLILIALLTLSFSTCFAGNIKPKALVLLGSWKNSSIWDQNRLPRDGDTVTIPLGSTIIIDDVQNISGDVYLKIYGILKFVGGKISMGDSSKIYVFETGLIMKQGSPSETIRIGNALKFGKDDEAIVGPAFATALTPNSPLAFKLIPGFESTLIVKVSGFNAVKKNDNVNISWSATDETNAKIYELQRSFDGNDWKSIVYIAPIGTVDSENAYSYTDKNVAAKTVYYRLKHVDNSGRFGFTQVKFINTLNNQEVRIASMPQNKVLIQFSDDIKGAVNVYLTSISGQVLNQQIIANPKGQVVLETSVLSKGSYVVTISNNQNINISKQVIF